MSEPPATLFATLGLHPQIITRTLDRLLERNVAIQQAIVLYTTTYAPHPSWPTLSHLQAYLHHRYSPLLWHWVPIQNAPTSPILADVQTAEHALIAFRIIYRQLRWLKQEGWCVHALIAGGRKSIIVYTMTAAQLLFDTHDQLWHLFSHSEDQTPHVPPTVSQLVPIPIIHLGGLMPMVRQFLLHTDDPTLIMPFYQAHEEVENILRLHQFWLTCEQLDQQIIQLASLGYSNSQIGELVGLSQSAVNNHISAVADRFFRSPAYGKKLALRPKHIRPLLLRYLQPLLNKLPPPV